MLCTVKLRHGKVFQLQGHINCVMIDKKGVDDSIKQYIFEVAWPVLNALVDSFQKLDSESINPIMNIIRAYSE